MTNEPISLRIGDEAKAAVTAPPEPKYLQVPVQKVLRAYFMEKNNLNPTTRIRLLLWTSKSAIRWYWHWMEKYPDLYPKGLSDGMD